MATKKKLPTRPWWMINGAREPMGDVNTDYLDGERFRWGMVEDEGSEHHGQSSGGLNETLPK